jgi:hypothetical protein
MSELLTKAERIRRAMDRAEQAMVDLIYQAEHFSLTGRSMHDIKCYRRDLLNAARRYSRAMDAVTRIRA